MGQRGKHTKIWIEGYHLTTKISNIAPGTTFDELDESGYEEDKKYRPGQGDGMITLDGYFDESTGATHDAIKTVGTDGQVLVTAALGNNATPTLGDITASLMAEQFTYDVNPDLKGLIAANATFKAKGKIIEYGILLADVTVTANGNQSSVDNGASSANGGVGYLHILGLSAGDTITGKVQHSTDNAAWSDLITFTLDGSALDAERIEVSGTVNRYVRASYTVTGASISFPIAVVFIRK